MCILNDSENPNHFKNVPIGIHVEIGLYTYLSHNF